VVLLKGVPYRATGVLPLIDYSAVSGECLMTRRSVFEQVGGFSSPAAVGQSDIDYCLRLREAGYRQVVHPQARLRFVGEPPADASAEARRRFSQIWAPRMPSDPHYNPNWAQDDRLFQLPVGTSPPDVALPFRVA
jgi:cellulose synthase/poly-beta-1,6-N-acetylglucosamine synthase-like glycosyltransferase